jgi:hypothetical protein
MKLIKERIAFFDFSNLLFCKYDCDQISMELKISCEVIDTVLESEMSMK